MTDRLFRATAALLLAFVVAQLAGGAALAASGRDPHTCDDHVCFCRRPAAAGPQAPCHGGAAEEAARVVPACSHDTDPVTASAVRPALLPPPPGVAPGNASTAVPAAVKASLPDVFDPIDSPPPRSPRPDCA
jgi:hypothetical protein